VYMWIYAYLYIYIYIHTYILYVYVYLYIYVLLSPIPQLISLHDFVILSVLCFNVNNKCFSV